MRLKSLEISGFKSFANKVIFSFPANITAVVGPNGSGKSNVADAIRWVLGERDLKGLRVKKSEDIIFGGTPKKAKMSLAQVILKLDNRDRKIPVDFEEIEIARRLNRAGESEYLINGSQVRLKDLIELLAKAKIGYSGITIVNQGLADSIIKASPKERRSMIEENLGLREFQLKKGEATRKLVSTTNNLEKTKSLVDELLPHLRSLRRQVSRWEKREEISDKLKLTEKVFFGSQFKNIFQSEDSLNKKLKDLKEKVGGQESILVDLEKKFEKLEEERPDFSQEFGSVQLEIEKLEKQKSEIFRDLGNIEGQIKGIKRLTENNQISNTNSNDLEKVLKDFRESLKRIVSFDSLESLKKEIEKIIVDLNEILDNKPEVELPKKDLNDNPEILKLEKEKEVLNKSIEKLDEEIKGFKLKLEEVKKKDSQAGAESKSVWSKLQIERGKLDDLKRELNDVLISSERVKIKRSDLEEKLRESGLSKESFSFKDLKDFQIEEETKKAGFNQSEDLENKIFRMRRDLASIGEVDELLVQEAQETEERYTFLSSELGDLEKAKGDLENIVAELITKIDSIFNNSLKEINTEFNKYFRAMFGGGSAKLVLVKPVKRNKEEEEESKDEEVEMGIEFQLDLPRKKVNSLEVLSGGERTLVSISALFAIVAAMDPPFAVLDEIDAALDETNAKKFAKILSELTNKTQFVMITHNRATMESAQALFGVTMSDEGVSKAISIKLEEV